MQSENRVTQKCHLKEMSKQLNSACKMYKILSEALSATPGFIPGGGIDPPHFHF